MMAQPFSDLLVVVPGIMGSVLTADGQKLWTVNSRQVLPALARLAARRKRLQLPTDLGDQAPNDGVVATALLPDLHSIPGLWTINGYGKLVEFLLERFTLTESTPTRPGNLVCFAYDWRLSNRLNGERLADRIDLELGRWRHQSGNAHAKVVFICHSMGGLVARWFIDVLDGFEMTAKLITIGTPYQGAPPAIDALVNGVHKGLWPLQLNLTALARSLPSIYQLLPVYPCIDPGNGTVRAPAELSLPNLDDSMRCMVTDAARFHEEMHQKAVANVGRYEIYALKGTEQSTRQTARLVGGKAVMDDRAGDRNDPRGDGTVPRPSSHPPEWDSESGHTVQGFAQAHASLQNTTGLHVSLFQILTADRLGRTAGGSPISVVTPDLVPIGEPISIRVTAKTPTLALYGCADDNTANQILLTNNGDGHYSGQLPPQSPGQGHTVSVYSASPLQPVDPVTTVVTVWDPEQVPDPDLDEATR